MRQVCRKKKQEKYRKLGKSKTAGTKCHASHFIHDLLMDQNHDWVYLFDAIGFLKTRMTESPRKNILLMYLSLLTGLAFFLPRKKIRKNNQNTPAFKIAAYSIKSL